VFAFASLVGRVDWRVCSRLNAWACLSQGGWALVVDLGRRVERESCGPLGGGEGILFSRRGEGSR